MASPIADLSYRNYDGPLDPPINRWWSIAKASMRLSLKKKGFWVLASFSAYWYALLMVVFYFMETISQNVPLGQKNPFMQQIIWKDQFLNAFGISQLMLFIIALLIGVGSIANDNRANALLVYLSKPVSRLDYLIGKWLGIFVPITCVVAVPMFVFYGYCLMSYRDYGFLTEDPKLFFKLLVIMLIPGVFHASVALGISSLFNQGRLAGATYAGLFFISLSFTNAMGAANMRAVMRERETPALVKTLFYCSVDGIQIGMAKIILNTDGSGLFPQLNAGPRAMRRQGLNIPPPPAALFVPGFFLICGLSLLLAWSRIRAVEVVG